MPPEAEDWAGGEEADAGVRAVARGIGLEGRVVELGVDISWRGRRWS